VTANDREPQSIQAAIEGAAELLRRGASTARNSISNVLLTVRFLVV